MKKLNAKTISICGVLTAMTIVLAEFLGVNLPMIQISFNFIPLIFAALCFGPVYTCIIAALADFLGVILFQGGGFNPMFTIIAALAGLAYGVWLYDGSPVNRAIKGAIRKLCRNSSNPDRIGGIVAAFIASLFNSVVFTLICTPVVLHIWYKLSYAALYPSRLVKVAVMIPLETVVISLVETQVIPRLKKTSMLKKA